MRNTALDNNCLDYLVCDQMTDAERAVREEVDLHYWLDTWGHRLPLYMREELRVIARNQVRAIETVKAQCQAFVLERMEHWKRDENEACAKVARKRCVQEESSRVIAARAGRETVALCREAGSEVAADIDAAIRARMEAKDGR